MRYTKEQFEQKYNQLDDILKTYITENTDHRIYLIAKAAKLDLKAWQALGSEIGYVLVGLESEVNFAANMKQYIGLDDATTIAIAKEVEAEIFVPFGDLNVPATLDEAPEREVTLRKILTPNAILNKQLEVPMARPLYSEPTPQKSIQNLTREAIQTPALEPMQQTTAPMPQSQAEIAGEPSILGARLGGKANMPREEVKIKNDPYREPLE